MQTAEGLLGNFESHIFLQFLLLKFSKLDLGALWRWPDVLA